MLKRWGWLWLACLSCTQDAGQEFSENAPARAAAEQPPPARHRPADQPCGLWPDDWCASPHGDPCGEHRDEPSCRADPRCVGLKYRGEAIERCHPDGHGFWTNCRAVGCITRVEPVPEAEPTPRHRHPKAISGVKDF